MCRPRSNRRAGRLSEISGLGQQVSGVTGRLCCLELYDSLGPPEWLFDRHVCPEGGLRDFLCQVAIKHKGEHSSRSGLQSYLELSISRFGERACCPKLIVLPTALGPRGGRCAVQDRTRFRTPCLTCIGQHISDTLSTIWPVFCYTSAGLGQRVSGVPDRIART